MQEQLSLQRVKNTRVHTQTGLWHDLGRGSAEKWPLPVPLLRQWKWIKAVPMYFSPSFWPIGKEDDLIVRWGEGEDPAGF